MALSQFECCAADHRVLTWAEQLKIVPGFGNLDTHEIGALSASAAEPRPFSIGEGGLRMYEELARRDVMNRLYSPMTISMRDLAANGIHISFHRSDAPERGQICDVGAQLYCYPCAVVATQEPRDLIHGHDVTGGGTGLDH